MNSVTNKINTIRKKHRSVVPVSSDRFDSSTQKKTGAARHTVKNASSKEFFLLKDISGFNNKDLANMLGITHRTVHNKKNNNEFFDISQTERLRKLIHLFTEGAEIFGNKIQFKQWLHKPSYGLDYITPFELLHQPGGLDKVGDEINSIKFGDAI